MQNANCAPSHNGKTHATTFVVSTEPSAVLPKKQNHSRLSVSLDVVTDRDLRDLAFKERTSESAIVEAALRAFFDSESAMNLRATLARLGIEPRRRKVTPNDSPGAGIIF
jgi:hypothetical protein